MHFTNSYQWSLLLQAFSKNRLPQVFLFSGENGLGKKEMALQFIKYLNCQAENATEKPCSTCLSCKLIEKENYPDFFSVAPEKREITVDQIRDLQKVLSNRSSMGGYKAILIDQADSLNTIAQNCLLKTLEEPAGATIFFLISAFPNSFLPTILSRCEQIKFYRETPAEVPPETLKNVQNLLEKNFRIL